jgi:hypothetical protein
LENTTALFVQLITIINGGKIVVDIVTLLGYIIIMVKKEIPPKIRRKIQKLVAEFCRENPQIDTLEKFEQVMDKVIVVACIPPALYQRYRNSGKTFDQVYEEITAKGN